MHIFGSWGSSRAGMQPGVWWRSPTTGTLRLSAIPEGPEDAGPSTTAAAAAGGADPEQQQQEAAAAMSPSPSSTQLEGSCGAASSGRPPVEEACAWALHIRHFTDCVPLDSFPLESLCSMNLDTEDLDQSACGDASVELQAASPCSKAWGSSHLWQQQQQQPSQQQQQAQLDPVKTACQLLGPPTGPPHPTPATEAAATAGAAAAAAAGGGGAGVGWWQQRQALSQQRVQAWLLGSSPHCPLDTTATTSSSSGVCPGTGSCPGTPDRRSQCSKQQQQQQVGGALCISSPLGGLSSSSSGQLIPAGHTPLRCDAAAAAAAGELSGDDPGVCGDGDASFDAPDWWQAAVMERWAAQRQEFSRSWVKRALMWMQLTAAKTTPNLVNS